VCWAVSDAELREDVCRLRVIAPLLCTALRCVAFFAQTTTSAELAVAALKHTAGCVISQFHYLLFRQHVA